MQLVRFRHKGLRQLHEDGNAKGVPSAMADKVRELLFALETAASLEQLGRFPGWRLIFGYEEKTNTAGDIDLIDYH
jgi:plasmid maintenance system killer protein